jgi:hypothetical protein
MTFGAELSGPADRRLALLARPLTATFAAQMRRNLQIAKALGLTVPQSVCGFKRTK